MKPILFNTALVRAILDGRKTQTRRPGKQRYQVGDILYVRETWAEDLSGNFYYKADGHDYKWKPSIHMPKKAARLFMKVTDVWSENIYNISREDVFKEGSDCVLKFKKSWISIYHDWSAPVNVYEFEPFT